MDDGLEGLEQAQIGVARSLPDRDLARRRGYDAASSFPDILQRVAYATGPLPERLATTHWSSVEASGKGEPGIRGSGQIVESRLVDFVWWLQQCATEFRPKGASRVFVHGISRWGGSEDAQAVRIDWLWADCDAQGEWFQLRDVLDRCGVAYVASRSGGHTPNTPKWHIHFPLARSLTPPALPRGADPAATTGPRADAWKAHEQAIAAWKAKYRDECLWIFGVLSRIGGLAVDGLDPKIADRLFQPSYPAARRHALAAVAEIHYREGRALDWQMFLEATGYSPTPAATYRKPREIDPEKATAMHAALAHDGYILEEQSDGKYVLRCPWEREHSSPGGRGTILFPNGNFHCSHGHCRHRTNADVLAILSPEARTFIDGANETAGVRRLRQRLQKHEDTGGERVSLDELAKRIDVIVREHRPGGATVIVAPPGSGKNRAINAYVPYHPTGGVVVAPRHDLAKQHYADITANTIARVQHRQGVLACEDDNGEPLCAQFQRASRMQAAGADVSSVVCRTCTSRKGCRAIKKTRENSEATIVVTVPQLAHTARKSVADKLGVPPQSVLVVYDEGFKVFESADLRENDLREALEALDDDARLPKGQSIFDTYRLEPLRALARVLCTQRGGALSVTAACDLAPCSLPRLPRGADRPPLPDTLERIVGQYVRDPIGLDAGLDPSSGAVWSADPDALAAVLKVVIPLAELTRAIDHNGPDAIEWMGGVLRVRTMTDAARDFERHGGIVTDATPREHEILSLAPHAVFHTFDVPDGAPIAREIVYRKNISKRELLQNESTVRWSEFTGLLREAVSRAQRAGCQRVLVVTHRVIAEALKAGAEPAAVAAREILTNAGFAEYDLAHYGAVRGLNKWMLFDACVTIGDAWENIISTASDIRALCRRVGVEPTEDEIEAAMLAMAEGEELQAHNRLRDPVRRVPAWHWHFGNTVPAGWTERNATVSGTELRGRPKGTSTMSASEFGWWVTQAGGTKQAAERLGVDPRTIRRYLDGSRTPQIEIDTGK